MSKPEFARSFAQAAFDALDHDGKAAAACSLNGGAWPDSLGARPPLRSVYWYTRDEPLKPEDGGHRYDWSAFDRPQVSGVSCREECGAVLLRRGYASIEGVDPAGRCPYWRHDG